MPLTLEPSVQPSVCLPACLLSFSLILLALFVCVWVFSTHWEDRRACVITGDYEPPLSGAGNQTPVREEQQML